MKQNYYNMRNTILFAFALLTIGVMTGCRKQMQVRSFELSHYDIDAATDSIADLSYEQALAPYKTALQEELNVVLGYAEAEMIVRRPECSMVNWTADALLVKARQYCPEHVDMALVNIGGVRCNWPKGDITRRNVFELMPFDNKLVVLTLSGQDILELCQVMAEVDGEGVAGLRMSAEDKQLITATIDGNAIMPEKFYTVATSDYLSGGKDKLTPLTNSVARWDSHRLIRDLYMEYITEHPQVVAAVDGRMDVR